MRLLQTLLIKRSGTKEGSWEGSAEEEARLRKCLMTAIIIKRPSIGRASFRCIVCAQMIPANATLDNACKQLIHDIMSLSMSMM